MADKIPIKSHVWRLLKISCTYGMPFANAKDTLIMSAFWCKAYSIYYTALEISCDNLYPNTSNRFA